MIKIGILQPSYIPWLGYFEQILYTDVFVFYDDVQYDRDGWRNRNRIKTHSGSQWLTVPVNFSLNSPSFIKDVTIDNRSKWNRKHLRSMEINYRKSLYFNEIYQLLKPVYESEWNNLSDLNIYIIKLILNYLKIERPLYKSSELNIVGGKVDRLIKICKFFNANIFYEGSAGRSYINEQIFQDHGISVKFQDYNHPVYTQNFGDFISHLSIIDLLFNEGINSNLIINNQRE